MRRNAVMFKPARVKELKELQKEEHVEYGREHQFKHIIGFWDGVIFTDEAYVNPNDIPTSNVLRVQGTREDLENMVTLP